MPPTSIISLLTGWGPLGLFLSTTLLLIALVIIVRRLVTDVVDVRNNMIWPDTFEEYKQKINERFNAIDEKVNTTEKNAERRLDKLESKVFNGAKN